MIRTLFIRIGLRELDALLCPQGGRRELGEAKQPLLPLAHISCECLWREQQAPCPQGAVDQKSSVPWAERSPCPSAASWTSLV